jgi:hypothetical protein
MTFRELHAMVQNGRITKFQYEAIILKIHSNRRDADPRGTGWTHMPSNGRATRKGKAAKMRDHWRGSNGRRWFVPSDARAMETRYAR